MIPWVRLDVATIPGGGELRLLRRGAEFSIMLGTNPLMNSRMSGSEEALANLTCARLAGRRRPHLLIGGLGMGFTLRAALAELPKDAAVTVAELVPKVIEWARGPLAALFGESLDDPRVTLVRGDVADLLREGSHLLLGAGTHAVVFFGHLFGGSHNVVAIARIGTAEPSGQRVGLSGLGSLRGSCGHKRRQQHDHRVLVHSES